jgi:hypothetical protein
MRTSSPSPSSLVPTTLYPTPRAKISQHPQRPSHKIAPLNPTPPNLSHNRPRRTHGRISKSSELLKGVRRWQARERDAEAKVEAERSICSRGVKPRSPRPGGLARSTGNAGMELSPKGKPRRWRGVPEGPSSRRRVGEQPTATPPSAPGKTVDTGRVPTRIVRQSRKAKPETGLPTA